MPDARRHPAAVSPVAGCSRRPSHSSELVVLRTAPLETGSLPFSLSQSQKRESESHLRVEILGTEAGRIEPPAATWLESGDRQPIRVQSTIPAGGHPFVSQLQR